MRGGVRRPADAGRLTMVLAMHRTACLASLILAIGPYVVSPAAQAAGHPAARRGIPHNGTAPVGALFTISNGKLGSHFCTASVIHSPAVNHLITPSPCLMCRTPLHACPHV